ncbi:hypothetical protein [Ralstonia chuxiongensis]|uniref:hypothetical protein n=1 Tax=Ralstonia chuxiongensis TaxID=2957504 RepID=UPI0028F5C7F6|nr:hypothetical protein [Ralstonia chuxiongensis]CAJ0781506.1 hypothetical protein R8510_04883 [Ralstonia chuxiongensis]
MNAPNQPETTLLERAGSIRSTEELREAVLAEVLHDVLEVVRMQQDVATLFTDTDKRFAGTVQVMREEHAKLAGVLERLSGLVGRSEDAFKGELALRAAEHTRKEFLGATRDLMEQVARDAAVSRMRRLLEALVVAGVTSFVTLAGTWALLHR